MVNLNVADTYQQAVHNLFSVSNISSADKNQDACKASIESLAEHAKSGDEDAIELLINFSSGADHPDIRQFAERSLIDVYMDSEVSAHTKSQIEAQALVFHEVTEKSNEKRGDMALAPHEISPQILYLAGQRAHNEGYQETKTKINQCLHEQIYKHGNGEHDMKLLEWGRFVSGEELINHGAQFSNLKLHTICLDLENHASFKKAIGEISSGLNNAAPTFITCNTGGSHWVKIMLQQAPGAKVNCCVFDSNSHEGSPLSKDIETKLTTALGGKMGELYFKGASMQENTPNACGPLGILLESYFNSNCNVNDSNFDWNALKAGVDKSVDSWNELTPEQQKAVVTGIRAQLLGAMVRANA